MALEVNYERLQQASWATYRMDWLAGLRWAFQLPGAEIGAIIKSITLFTMPELGGTSLAINPEEALLSTLTSHALYLPGTSGSFISTPDALALDITGSIDIRIEYQYTDFGYALSASPGLVAKWGAAGQRSYRVTEAPFLGSMSLDHSADGTATVGPGSAGAHNRAIRMTLDSTNGTKQYFTAPTMDDTFVQVDSDAGTATSILAGTAVLVLGASDSAGTANMFKGRITRAQVRSGIGGSIVANPDFRNLSPGTTSFADSAGLTWTLQGNAVII